MNVKRPTLTLVTLEEPNGSTSTGPDPQRNLGRPSRVSSYSAGGSQARLDRAPTPRGTSPMLPIPSRPSANETPEAFAAFVEQARSWADDILSRREGVQQELAAWREGLEALTLSLENLERQLERSESHGLTAGASMHLFYLSRALERQDRPSASAQTLKGMQNTAWQIRSALMRTSSFELER